MVGPSDKTERGARPGTSKVRVMHKGKYAGEDLATRLSDKDPAAEKPPHKAQETHFSKVRQWKTLKDKNFFLALLQPRAVRKSLFDTARLLLRALA